jgi:hypothetical protein
MADDLYERFAKDVVDAAARAAFAKGMEVGYGQGFLDGMQAGQVLGFVGGVRSVQDAISDGVRHGSSKCGRALEAIKRLDIDDDE